MFIQRVRDSPQNRRGGQVSYLLLEKGQFGSSNLAITWVEGEPGSEQQIHEHPESEQVYVVVRGRGLMQVGDIKDQVEAGDMIYIPAGSGHAIRNIGDDPLIYVSATSPPFDAQRLDSAFRYTPPKV